MNYKTFDSKEKAEAWLNFVKVMEGVRGYVMPLNKEIWEVRTWGF